jgi:hypothetical protein
VADASTKVVKVGDEYIRVPADATDAPISSALNAIPASNAASSPKARTWTDVAVDAIPAFTGTAGAIIGGAGGTVAGMGVGGVPGAAGGAAVGTAGGEALKQLINRARGADAPATSGEAATQIAVPAAVAGATTGALGAAGQAVRPYAGSLLQKIGGAVEQSPSLRQLAGRGITAAGQAMDSSPAPKPSFNVQDILKIQDLVKAGQSEAQAVKDVWALKLQNILRK